MSDGMTTKPIVTVLMYAFRYAAFIHRALESLFAQQFEDWELIVLDDASPDETLDLVATAQQDRRVRYERLDSHLGMGAALNHGLGLAAGRYIAYLPADDLWYPEHLARLVGLLEINPEAVAAYGDARWGYSNIGSQPALAENGHATIRMVQVVHRHIHGPRWVPHEKRVTDTVEELFWREIAHYGTFVHHNAATCEWVDHSFKWVRMIATPGGGLARYRQFYNLGRGIWLDFQPSRGMPIDERSRYGRFAGTRDLPQPGGLNILMVGELGFNPERIMALEEQGHKLYGMWQPNPESWNTTGPFAYGNVENIPFDRNWRDAVRAVRPDVIYGLLNFFAVPMLAEVLDADLGIPVVFHFKEGPFLCLEKQLWPALVRVLRGSDGLVFISSENREWFEQAVGAFEPERTLILDGDLPKRDWMTDDWTPKLSTMKGELHTVCAGRPIGLPFHEAAAASIHVHCYTGFTQQNLPDWAKQGLATGFLHLHPPVEPNEWTKELSQYDAAWLHVFESDNGGDLRRARWDDLNLPARLGTYAAAGLPWMLKDSGNSLSAVHNLAHRHEIGIFFRTVADLAAQLADGKAMARLTANARSSRPQFAFDTHVPALVDFFRRVIALHDDR